MKKIITFILALVMIMSMVACSSTANEDPIPSTPVETPITEDIPTVSKEPVETPNEDSTNEYIVEITGCTVTEDYEGNPALVVLMTWTNNSDETASYAWTLNADAYQDGVGLEFGILLNSDYSDMSNAKMTEIKPGVSLEVAEVFSLRDTSTPVEIEISELISFDDTILESGIYNFS